MFSVFLFVVKNWEILLPVLNARIFSLIIPRIECVLLCATTNPNFKCIQNKSTSRTNLLDNGLQF